MRVLSAAALVLGPALAAQAGVQGRVLDADGRPLAGVTVSACARETAEQQGERQAAGRARASLGTARTGPDGTFRLEAVGLVAAVEARADGHAPALGAVSPDGPTTLTLRKTALRRGVVRAGGSPVPGAVVVWSADGAEIIARTAADGSYEAPDPQKAPGQVRVFHPMFAFLEAGAWGNGANALDLDLQAGTSVAGLVVDEAQRPVPGATLWLDGQVPAGRSDAKGEFHVPHAHAGLGFIAARTDRLAGAEPRQGGRVVVRVRAAPALFGTVRDATTGRPLAGATVVASNSRLGASVSADTDAQGQYALKALLPGRYRAYAGRAGYASGPAGYQTAEPVDLRSAASSRSDFTITRLPRVSGRVEDDQHRPIESALVALGIKSTPNIYVRGAAGLGGGDEGSARTAADGSFTLTLPLPSESSEPFGKDRPLVVLKEGYAAAQVDAKRLAAAGGAPVVVTLTRGIELSGRVATLEGVPLAGVSVSAAEDGALGGTMIPTHLLLASFGDEGWTTTDEAGRFALRVHPAVHHLSFKKEGYAPATVRGHDPRSGQALEVALEPAAVLRGRVTRADGRGVSGVSVAVTQPMTVASETGTTAEDGTFALGNLARGTYELVATHAELGLHETRTVEVPASDLQIVLPPRGSIRGSVVDSATRRPVPRFTVDVTAPEGSAARNRTVPVEEADGRFSIDDVPLGKTVLTVSAEGYATRRVEDVTVSSDADAPEVELALEADAPIAGRVSSDRGRPVPEAWVTVETDAGAPPAGPARTDDDGEFELRGVASGEVTLRVQAPGFLPEKRKVDDRQRARLEITLKKGLVLRGEVVGEGAGVPRARVTARSSARGAGEQTGQTDERGRFALEGLVPGRYTVTASATGMAEAKSEDVDVEQTEFLRLVLERARTAVLAGKVVGLPEADELTIAMVMATTHDGQQMAQAMVDASHAFRMEDAPAGRVQVRAMATSPTASTMRSSRTVELTLAPGSETETVLEFPGDLVIRGMVIRNGGPLPGVMVSFAAASRADMGVVARTDARGAYEVVGLEAGPHRVSVFGDGVSFNTEYVVTGSADFDIDVTGGTVAGRVVRAEGGTPVAGVAIAFFRVGGKENTPVETATTSAQGGFSQGSLRDGRYRLVTSKAGFGQEVREVEVARGGTAEVSIELQEAEGVSLSVVDARDGRPLEAIVVVRDEARRIVANSHSGVGEDGVLNIPLASGAYLLSTSASGYGTATLRVRAPSQGLRVALTPGGTLRIESQRDLRGRVRLVQPDGEEYVRCWCNGIADIELGGRLTVVENVTPGAYTAELVDPQGVPTARPVVIREGQVSMITIE